MANLEDEELAGLDLTEIENQDQSIDDIIAEDKKAQDDEDSFLRKEKNKKRSKVVRFSVLGVLIVAGTVGGVLVFDPFGGDQKIGDNSKNTTKVDDNDNNNSGDLFNDPDSVKEDDFYKDKYIPFDTDDWQQSSYDSKKDSETLRNDVLKTTSGNSLDRSSGTLPSETNGFTSDITKIELDDGTINPMFSYWTKEVFEFEVGLITERLLNPVFGGWEDYQWAEYNASVGFPVNLFSDIFTERYFSENIDNPYAEWVPVYADWNSDNYGLSDQMLPSGSRWFGQAVSSEVVFTYDEDTSQYNVVYVVNVKFTAWKQDQTKLEKNGTLTLNLVSNVDLMNSSNNRVLIDGASLKIND